MHPAALFPTRLTAWSQQLAQQQYRSRTLCPRSKSPFWPTGKTFQMSHPTRWPRCCRVGRCASLREGMFLLFWGTKPLHAQLGTLHPDNYKHYQASFLSKWEVTMLIPSPAHRMGQFPCPAFVTHK